MLQPVDPQANHQILHEYFFTKLLASGHSMLTQAKLYLHGLFDEGLGLQEVTCGSKRNGVQSIFTDHMVHLNSFITSREMMILFYFICQRMTMKECSRVGRGLASFIGFPVQLQEYITGA